MATRGTPLRSTQHRRAVLQVFMAAPARRLTADALAQCLLQQGDWVAMPTIYNTLRLLIAQGLVERSDTDGGRGVFWLRHGDDRSLHQLMCRSCRRSFAPHHAALVRRLDTLGADHGLPLGEPSALVQLRCGDCLREQAPRPATASGPAGDAALDLLRQAALRATRSQRVVLQVFLDSADVRHTAQAVAQRLQQARGAMAVGTLYRVLDLLVGARILQKAWSQGRSVFWRSADGRAQPHRIVCRCCRRGFSTGDAALERTVAALARRCGESVPTQALQIQIRCRDCTRENRPTAPWGAPAFQPFHADASFR